MEIFIDPNASSGLAEQIYEGIRAGVVEGRFAPGDRLPPSRELAETLGVSRHTVTTAYGRLSAEGFLDGRRGGGTVVSDLHVPDATDSDAHLPLPPPSAETRDAGIRYSLRTGLPDPRLFPLADWKRHARWAIDRHEPRYGEPQGLTELRLVVAQWIGRSRGVDAGFRQVVITSGAQQALYLLVRVVAGTGGVVAMEDPGYHRFRTVVEASGARLAFVPVDEEGIVVEAIPHQAKLVYVTPSHQFPTGVTMSMSRRLDLLALGREAGMMIIEDDYDSEYRYVDRPLEPLFRLDRAGLVSYVASFSKVLSPALRLGFVVLPPSLLGPVLDLRRQIDWSPSTVDQLTLRGLVVDGDLDRHLRKTRRVYRRRYHQVSSFLEEAARGGVVAPPASHAGLHVSTRLGTSVSEQQVIRSLAERGVGIAGFREYSSGSPAVPEGLVFGFSLVDEAELTPALSIVEDVLAG